MEQQVEGIKVKQMAGLEGVVIGNRIPQHFFTTSGKGESDITVHAGSYHLALKAAGIEMCNIMTYSSILPGIAQEVPKPDVLIHGSVMETIMAVSHAEKGQRATAGVVFAWLYDRESKRKFGGLVCEHNGDYGLVEVKKKLLASLDELYYNGFSEQFEMQDPKMLTESFVPEKKNGTALVAIGFVDYFVPILSRRNYQQA